MTSVMKWLVAIIIFGLIILFHEFGHFIVAKLYGVKVEEFSIGFGPRLLSAVKNGTRYSLKLLPFGGSCAMKGMLGLEDEEDENPEGEHKAYKGYKEDKGYISFDQEYSEDDNANDDVISVSKYLDDDIFNTEDEDSFNSKSVGKRLAIIFAGPFFNLLLAFAAAVVLISVMGYDPSTVSAVDESSPAAEAGLEAGDVITSINGKKVDIGKDVSAYFMFNELQEDDIFDITVLRGDEKTELVFAPETTEKYMMGITYYGDTSKAELTGVTKGSPAEEAGLEAGDVITSINGEEISSGEELSKAISEMDLSSTSITLTYVRGVTERETTFTPIVMTSVSTGFSCNNARVKTSPTGVLKYSFVEIRFWIETVLESLKQLFTGQLGVRDLSGPVGTVNIISDAYEESAPYGALITSMNMLYILILLSANVGVMNLLPFPAIDGGRIVFLIIEGITGKKVPQKVEEIINFIGVTLLIILMVFVMYYDIGKVL